MLGFQIVVLLLQTREGGLRLLQPARGLFAAAALAFQALVGLRERRVLRVRLLKLLLRLLELGADVGKLAGAFLGATGPGALGRREVLARSVKLAGERRHLVLQLGGLGLHGVRRRGLAAQPVALLGGPPKIVVKLGVVVLEHEQFLARILEPARDRRQTLRSLAPLGELAVEGFPFPGQLLHLRGEVGAGLLRRGQFLAGGFQLLGQGGRLILQAGGVGLRGAGG